MHEQRSKEWFDDRLGYITASRFGDVMTKARGAGISKTAESYINEKIAELMTGQSRELSGEALSWGVELESQARNLYEITRLVEVKNTGFIKSSCMPYVGGSPDGLVGIHGGIEIKCPYNTVNHLEYMKGVIPKAYYAQIQGNIWISGLDWIDFVSYDPRLIDEERRLYIQRVERNTKFIAEELVPKLDEFIKVYLETLKFYNLSINN